MLAIYLSAKEIWRNKARFFAVCMVIGLITLLVLFIAALGEGLALANKEYIDSIDAELIVFQEDVDLSIISSRLDRSKLNDLTRIDGVKAVGPIGFSSGSVVFPDGSNIDVALIGVEPNAPGSPQATIGEPLISRRANEVVIDKNLADQADLPVGSTLQLQVVQGTKEEIYSLRVVGHTTGRQYQFQPSIFVPLLTWDKVKPQAVVDNTSLSYNVVALQVDDPANWEAMIPVIETAVDGIEITDPVTTYENSPGYAAQQSTVNTQQFFTLLIATLVIGGFFQIQTLQKIGQIGMLKAIGASNRLVAWTLVVQVILTTIIGLAIGGSAAFLFSLILPSGTPIQFQGQAVITAMLILLGIGPIGGLISVRTLLKVEPLTALGLGS